MINPIIKVGVNTDLGTSTVCAPRDELLMDFTNLCTTKFSRKIFKFYGNGVGAVKLGIIFP